MTFHDLQKILSQEKFLENESQSKTVKFFKIIFKSEQKNYQEIGFFM